MAARRAWWTIALALILAACSESTASPTVVPSGSPTATGTAAASPVATPTAAPPSSEPTPTPRSLGFTLLAATAPAGYTEQIRCSGRIGSTDSVAIVELRKQSPSDPDQLVLRDYADPAHPRTVCTFGASLTYGTHLIDARHVVINACNDGDCRNAVVDLPDVRYHWFVLPHPRHTVPQLVAVSPNLDEVAWISSKNDGTGRRLHLTRADGDHAVASLRDVGGRCGSPEDSKLGDYTRSGRMIYVLDVPIGSDAVLLVFAGMEKQLAQRPPAGGWPYGKWPAFPVWTPDGSTLYFRSGGHGWQWNLGGGRHPFAPAADWRYPTITPDGRHLAWARIREDGFHDIYLMDMFVGGQPKLIARRSTTPAFLNDDQLWFVREGRGVCGTGANDRVIYSVTERTTAGSIIQGVWGIWPATSSNF